MKKIIALFMMAFLPLLLFGQGEHPIDHVSGTKYPGATIEATQFGYKFVHPDSTITPGDIPILVQGVGGIYSGDGSTPGSQVDVVNNDGVYFQSSGGNNWAGIHPAGQSTGLISNNDIYAGYSFGMDDGFFANAVGIIGVTSGGYMQIAMDGNVGSFLIGNTSTGHSYITMPNPGTTASGLEIRANTNQAHYSTFLEDLGWQYSGISNNTLEDNSLIPKSYIEDLQGDGSPVGVETPLWIGQTYQDTLANPDEFYRATGTTNADWSPY